jgi:integrase
VTRSPAPSIVLTAAAIVARPTASLAAVAAAELPKYYTREQVRALVEACGSGRDRLMVETMWRTGVRVSELLSLSPASIDFAGEVLRAPTLKRRGRAGGVHVRTIPLRPALLGLLARHVAEHGITPARRLFEVTRQRVHQVVAEACARAGLPADRAHPHTLRHSFAVACVLARVPVLVLNEWLGHSTLEATLVYTKVMCADSRQYLEDVAF